MEHVNKLLKNLMGILLCSFGVFVCIVATFGLFFSHYLGISYGLDLMGLDTLPLYKEQFIGHIMQAFLPNANYTHLLAMEVAIMLLIGTFVCFHLVSIILHQMFERQEYVQSSDTESARLISRWMLINGVILIIFLIPTVALSLWDLNLFQYRIIAGATGADTPEIAKGIGNMAYQAKNNGNLWIFSSLDIGARGYLALILIAAFSLEYAMGKMGDNWTKLCRNMDLLIGGTVDSDAQPNLYGYDAEGYPVYDTNKAIVYDVNQKPVAASANTSETVSRSESHQARGAQNTETSTDRPLFSSDGSTTRPSINDNVATASCSEDETSDAPEKDVIGGTNGERVTLDQALANPNRFWVDPDSKEVWDADYRKNLFDEPKNKAA